MERAEILEQGVFAGRVAVVAGCSDDLGRALSHRLAALGARVIIIGVTDTRLLEIAKVAPERIETLSLSRGTSGTLAALRDAWDGPAIDFYFDLTPYCLRAEGTKRAVAMSRDLLGSLQVGLRRTGTRGMLVFDRTDTSGDMTGRIRGMLDTMSREIRPAALIGLSLSDLPQEDPVTQGNDARAERILSMLHPSVDLVPSEIVNA